MNTARHLAGVLTALGAAALVVLATTTTAWAEPAPLEREPARGGGTVVIDSGGTTLWEVVTIGTAGALVAAVVIGLVMLVVSHQHAAHRPAPTA